MSDLPRTALERVLARASELQNTSTTEPGESISEARLVEIAKEVGLDVQHVRQAIAEERAQISLTPEEAGGALSSLGPSVVSAQRTMQGTPEQLLRNLEAFLPRNEFMVAVRRTPERMVWEPRRDPLGNFFRSLGSGGRRFDLVRLDQLVISATQIDDTRSVLRFDAVVHGARKSVRNATLGTAAGMLLIMFVAAIPLVVLSLAVPQVAVVSLALMATLSAGVTWFSWRALSKQFRGMVGRVQQRLEYLLDEAQQGRLEAAPSLLDRMLKGSGSI
ncbi:MAG: hypothetical protein HEQ38_14925 [Gemmatimonas sp.]|nr:hypothetical protein [Gemmatimonas sp.]